MSVECPYESRGLDFIPIKYNHRPARRVVVSNPFYEEMSDLTGKSPPGSNRVNTRAQSVSKATALPNFMPSNHSNVGLLPKMLLLPLVEIKHDFLTLLFL